MASCRSTGSSDSRQRDVSVDRPPFGVLAVEGLVERDAEAAEHRAALEPAGDDLLAGSEQRVGVEVDRPGVDLDVPGVRQAGADQRPHRVQALEDRRPVIGQVLVDGVELPSLGGRAVQLLNEHRRASAVPCGAHEVTALG